MGVVPIGAWSPYLGMILSGIKLLGCFPRGYFVLLGFRHRFELLKQVISPCPKMFRLLWYEYEYRHGVKDPNTVLLLRPSSPETVSYTHLTLPTKRIV